MIHPTERIFHAPVDPETELAEAFSRYDHERARTNGEAHAEPSPDAAEADTETNLSVTPASTLMREYPELRTPLIEGILRRTETMNLISVAKIGKTHFALDLSLCIATGRAWLNHYAIRSAGPVLYIDCELHPATMSRRIAAICQAKGIFSDEIAGKLDVLSLRGKLRNIYQLRPWLLENTKGKYAAIVFDALYRLIPADVDENSNSAMTQVWNCIDNTTEETGAAAIIIHHASKGVQAGKSVVDVGAGASAMARATDSHLILRQHTEDGCVVMEAAARSWPPLIPVALRWNYPVWYIDASLDVNDLRIENRRKRKDEGADATTPKPEPWTVERFVASFIAPQPKTKAAIITEAETAEISERKAGRFIDVGKERGLIHQWTPRNPANPTRYATEPQPVCDIENGVTK